MMFVVCSAKTSRLTRVRDGGSPFLRRIRFGREVYRRALRGLSGHGRRCRGLPGRDSDFLASPRFRMSARVYSRASNLLIACSRRSVEEHSSEDRLATLQAALAKTTGWNTGGGT